MPERQAMVTEVTWAHVEGGRVKKILKTTLSLERVQQIFNKINENKKTGQGSRFIISAAGGEFEANDVFVDQMPDPDNTFYSRN